MAEEKKQGAEKKTAPKRQSEPQSPKNPNTVKSSDGTPMKKSETSLVSRNTRKKKETKWSKFSRLFDNFSKAVKNFFAQFGISVIAIAIVAYVFLQVMLNVGTLVDTESATYIDISDSKEIDAYLFRDEAIVPAVANGTNCFLVEDGEKVRKGEKVAVTYSNPEDVKIQQRIREIDDRIYVLEQSSLSTGASTTNIALLDTQISELTLSIIRRADSNEFDKIIRDKEKLLVLMNRRQAVIQAEDYSAEIEALKQEREQLNSSLSDNTSATPKSTKSGYFYSTVDGYENFFTMERLEELTAEDFENLSQAVPDESLVSGSAGKVVLSSTWYIAFAVDKRTAEGFVDGYTYPITFQYSNNTTLDMKAERRITRTDKDITILIFSTRQMPSDFDYSRCQTIELPHTDYEGLRIRTSALRMQDGKVGVYVVVGSKIIFKSTEVLYTYGSYSVCAIPKDPNYPNRRNIAYSSSTQLSLHDSVVVNGEDIYDGMRIK